MSKGTFFDTLAAVTSGLLTIVKGGFHLNLNEI